MASHLSSGRLNLGILRDSYRRELLECIDKCSGSKAIVWDDALTGPIGLVAEYSLLKEHEVDKMFPLRSGRLPHSSVQNIIFLVRPELPLMDIIAENVHKEEQSGLPKKDFHIYFVSRKSLLCERRLKERGVYGTFMNVDEYCIDLVPFDSDLLSMEMQHSFKECVLENDTSSLYNVAKGLMVLQSLFGVIPNLYGKGQCSKHVIELLLRMRREMAGNESQITPQIDNLMIIDRTVDSLTPLLSQLTYEGLIDELFTINNTTVKLPAEKFAASDNRKAGGADSAAKTTTAELKKVILNSSEDLYCDLRDKNFNAVGPTLSRRAKMLTTEFDERHAAKTVGQIKQFVSKLPHMQAAKQSLATHTTIAELVKEVTSSDKFRENLIAQQDFVHGVDTDKVSTYIEDCIAKQEPLLQVLRLICVQCYCNNGFKPKLLDHYKREIIQTYGYKHMLTLMNLEKAGLLGLQSHRIYPTLRAKLKLTVEDVSEQTPTDISYVYSGYAPLSVRLAQELHRPSGWRTVADQLNLLPGPLVEEIQQLPIGLRKRRPSAGSLSSSTGEQRVTLVFFVGGVTYAEISALRWLSHSDDAGVDYIIGATKIINGSTWLESLSEKLEAQPLNPF